jgi:hypothetical protein
MAKKMHTQTMGFVWTQCWKLSNSIIIANEISGGTSSFMKYSEAERLQLAEQFAQGTGIFMACVLVAKDQDSQPLAVDKYQAYQDDFTQYGYQAGKLSGQFATEDELIEYLEGLASLTVEQLSHYRIEPMRLHAAAMQTVEDHARENGKKAHRVN